jgi:hypothetical protein
MVLIALLGAARAAYADTAVNGYGNTIIGSGAAKRGSSGGTTATPGSLPPGSVVVQVPTIVGPGQYCLI